MAIPYTETLVRPLAWKRGCQSGDTRRVGVMACVTGSAGDEQGQSAGNVASLADGRLRS
jgi:hypothetical protein